MILKKNETSGGNPQKGPFCVDLGLRLLILDPSRKTIKFFFRIGIMCILKETLPSVLRTKTKGSELGSISLPRRNEIYLVADCKNQ